MGESEHFNQPVKIGTKGTTSKAKLEAFSSAISGGTGCLSCADEVSNIWWAYGQKFVSRFVPTSKQGTYSVCNKSAMSWLNWAVLVGVISSSGENVIAFLLEKILNLRMVEEFTLVQINILAFAERVILSKEVGKPLERWPF